MKVSQKIKNETTMRASSATAGYLAEENEEENLKRYMHICVHCSFIYNRQDMGSF